MNNIFRFLKGLVLRAAKSSKKSLFLNIVLQDNSLKPMTLTKCGGRKKKRIGFWRGCTFDIDYVSNSRAVNTELLYRTMYWRGCRYDVTIQSLDGVKATVRSEFSATAIQEKTFGQI